MALAVGDAIGVRIVSPTSQEVGHPMDDNPSNQDGVLAGLAFGVPFRSARAKEAGNPVR